VGKKRDFFAAYHQKPMIPWGVVPQNYGMLASGKHIDTDSLRYSQGESQDRATENLQMGYDFLQCRVIMSKIGFV
jgi:hypothetical protein